MRTEIERAGLEAHEQGKWTSGGGGGRGRPGEAGKTGGNEKPHE